MGFSLVTVALVLVVSVGAVDVAVVDYAPVAMREERTVYNATAALSQIIQPNLDAMEAVMAKAAAGGAKIVVFPEDGLYGPAFPTRESVFPFLETIAFPAPEAACGSQSAGAVVRFMSCAAQKHGVYVVLDMGELDGSKQYNTAVAFDPKGVLVARYRKQHLYFEPQFDPGPRDDPSTGVFDTPFGRVGLAICFDALFANVWERMQSNLVELMVAPTWWVNDPPLAISTAMHAGVARAINTSMLVAGVGLDWYNSGSLVVGRDGTVAAQHYNPSFNSTTTLLAASFDPTAMAAPVAAAAAAEVDPQVHVDLECKACEVLVQLAESKLGSNSTLSEIETFLNTTICGLLPGWLAGECALLVDEYAGALAARILAYESEYPVSVICDMVGLCGAEVFVAAAGSTGTVGSGACQATYQFADNVLAGERYGLLSYNGPYGAPGQVLFNLSTCAVVRCATKKHGCAMIYSQGGVVPAVSTFAQLSLSYQPTATGQQVMSWLTDGDYKVLPQAGGTATAALELTAPSTISSAAFWQIQADA